MKDKIIKEFLRRMPTRELKTMLRRRIAIDYVGPEIKRILKERKTHN